MKSKNDKVRIVFVVFLLYFVMSWLIEGGIFSSTGEFTSVGMIRMGIFDIVSIAFSSFYYRMADMMFLLAIGGCYQVMSQTLMYRKLIDKASDWIRGKEEVALALITSIMAILVSISSNGLIFFALAPFIVSIFLRNNYNRLTAFSAGFGGMFLGYLGLTFGTYNVTHINEILALSSSEWIVQKWIILGIALVVFNVFSIIYMKGHKNKTVDQTKYDLFVTEIVEEDKKVKNSKRKVKCWPLVVVLLLTFVMIVLGYIDWKDSFNLTIFDNLFTKINESLVISDVSVMSSILGSKFTAFGTWEDILGGLFFILLGIAIVAMISKVKLNDFLNEFAIGMKKMSRVTFIYGFATCIMFLISMFPWPIALVNNMFGSGTFNIIVVLLIGIIATIFVGDGSLCGFLFAAGIATLYSNYITEAVLIWRIGSAIAIMGAPTSVLLLTTLTYLNIPYKNWIKYIWKFLVVFILLVLILLAVIIYV